MRGKAGFDRHDGGSSGNGDLRHGVTTIERHKPAKAGDALQYGGEGQSGQQVNSGGRSTGPRSESHPDRVVTYCLALTPARSTSVRRQSAVNSSCLVSPASVVRASGFAASAIRFTRSAAQLPLHRHTLAAARAAATFARSCAIKMRLRPAGGEPVTTAGSVTTAGAAAAARTPPACRCASRKNIA